MKRIRRKSYNSIEAIHLIMSGEKVCHPGHAHRTGYYYDVSYALGYEENKIRPQIVEHNGDGSVYRENVNIIDSIMFFENGKFIYKKTWIVAKPKDFGLVEWPVTTRREPRVPLPPKEIIKKKSLLKQLLGVI